MIDSLKPQTELSILRNASEVSLQMEPFPHIVIHDALPEELASYLTESFPSPEILTKNNNIRIDISADQVNSSDNIPAIWREFINFHSSQKFFHEVVKIFDASIVSNNSLQLSSIKELLDLRVGTRNIDSFKTHDLLLDSQIAINSPVLKKSSVRKIHVDHTNKLYSGMLYLRQPHDDAIGGDLNLYKWKEGYTSKDKLKFYKESVDQSHVELCKQIKYKNNVCILFLNSIDALHGVTAREITSHQRTFVNFIGELPYDIFYKRSFFIRTLQNFKSLLRQLKNYL